MLPTVAFLLAPWLVAEVNAEFTFLTLGDWGGAALNGGSAANSQEYQNVMAVSAQMAQTATSTDAKFIINTGDNFYWCGIKNTSDFQIQTDLIDPYNQESLQMKWYSSLGNHEYGYNVSAQIEYSKMNPNWILPDRYYTDRIELDANLAVYATLVVLDTSPCISDYRGTNPEYWDPCSTQYPTCSQTPTDDDFEGECFFHEHILTQSCQERYDWLEKTLKNIPSNDWKIIVGHHPVDEMDEADFTSLLQKYGFSIYLNGHAHTLSQYTIDGKNAYVTSGAGALVNTYDQTHPVTKAKVEGRDISISGDVVDDYGQMLNVRARNEKHRDGEGSDHTYTTIFNQAISGFTSHTFNSDFTELTTSFISADGDVIHKFVVDKQGNLS